MNGSLFCIICGGDMLKGSCRCEHDPCEECIGCTTCGVHERRCSSYVSRPIPVATYEETKTRIQEEVGV